MERIVCLGGIAGIDWSMLRRGAKIQQRHELMNRRCVEAQRLLAEEGLKSSILKGQGVAPYYKLRDESLERIHLE